jgi:cytidylate kinase
VAIDGPAGAGKSTIARQLAQELGLRYLDTGAMYRALALKALETNVAPSDPNACADLLSDTEVSFGEGGAVLLDGSDVSDLVRTPEVGEAASSISTHAVVRKWLVARQQTIVAEGGVILEGRDATTVIAPDATLKIFLTASLEERANRRLLEFRAKGLEHEFEEVRVQVESRDHRDITRTESPLKVAKDAKVIETGSRSIEAIILQISQLLTATLEGK